MKEAILELNKQLEDFRSSRQHCNDAINGLQKVDDFPGRYQVIVTLTTKTNELSDKIKAITDAIVALQNVCSHPEWASSGNDSHYSYEKCTVCGFETKC
jgi:hypothetical protein